MNPRPCRPVCLALAVLIAALARPAAACTTGVVSGRATADGRPLLWKNRDTKDQHNQVVYSADGKFAFVAVVNAGSTGAVWMGVNDRGFCIENSVVKDLPRSDGKGPGNGSFMRQALATCATVAEFEALLDATNVSGRSTQANYGVIDAAGGAAIFETGHRTYTKFDANDPRVAPNGYVVRSNFTMTGTGDAKLKAGGDLRDVYAGERYLRADTLFRDAAAGKLDYRHLLRNCGRDLTDGRGCPLPGSVNGAAGPLPETVDTASTICRKTTVATAVFQGVRPGEDPLLTTMWVLLGEPAFGVAVPCWVRAGAVADPLKGDKRSPICSAAVALKGAFYDEKGERLKTDKLPDVWRKTWALEDAILADADKLLAQWRQTPPTRDEVEAFHRAAVGKVLTLMTRLKTTYAQPAAVGAGK